MWHSILQAVKPEVAMKSILKPVYSDMLELIKLSTLLNLFTITEIQTKEEQRMDIAFYPCIRIVGK